MAAKDIAAALQRMESVLRRRPEAGLHDDEPAVARWDGGARVVTSHENGTQLLTDLPAELGGGGDQVAPSWLLRAGVASCTDTRIAMAAATEGIELQTLEVLASSVSGARGLVALADAEGEPVRAGPRDVQLLVRISAHGVSPQRLRALVEDGYRCSPVSSAIRDAVPVALRIELIAE